MNFESHEIKFSADFCKVSGPLSDGSLKVELKTGEYEQAEIAKLMALIGDMKVYNVTIEVGT